MGRPKAFLPLEGTTFLGLILSRLAEAGIEAGVVTSPELSIEGAAVNLRPEDGQLSSLRVGLEAFARDRPWLMLVLVDHPTVSVETYRRLAEAADAGHRLVAPSFQGRRGHPVVFSRACYPDLLDGPLEEGARWVVGRHRHLRHEIAVDDPGILRDVDLPEDYRRLTGESP
ncbi:MAG: nucleotidyltransferase family protein [Candidatus Eremiobacteraeota bacterium]|nr:nucleotidyltransferase family protein [Candidatus Eremiobacteraeota bacterium]